MEPDRTPAPGHGPDLDARLALLRGATSSLDAPRCVEKELMQAFAARFPRKLPWHRRLNVLEWSTAAAGAAITACVLAILLAPSAPYGTGPYPPLVRLENGAAFIALDSVERIEQEPDPQLVEAELPRTVLAALGLPVAPEQAGEAVRAEMLMAADGDLLALRLSAIDN